MFLISVTEPLNLTLQSHLENEGKLVLGMVTAGSAGSTAVTGVRTGDSVRRPTLYVYV
jgi:hypothetical protein